MAVDSISAVEARAMAAPLPTTEEMLDDEETMNMTLSLRLGRVRGSHHMDLFVADRGSGT